MTGITSMIIHSGRLPDSRNASTSFRTLHQLLALGFRAGLAQVDLHLVAFDREVEGDQHVLDRFRADAALERVEPVFVLGIQELLFGQQLQLQRRQARLDDDVARNRGCARDPSASCPAAGRCGRQRLQEPDVRDRRRQLDMAHALAPHLRQGDLDAALLADDAAIFHALVLAAQALVVLDRTEDAGAEQTVALGLEGAVVDGLRLLDLAEGPRPDAFRARDRDRIWSKARAAGCI